MGNLLIGKIKGKWVIRAVYGNNNNNNNNNSVISFDSSGVEHIPKEIKALINNNNNKNIITNIFRIQAYNSITCGYFCISFTDFIVAGKTLTEYTNLFSPNNFKKNEQYLK